MSLFPFINTSTPVATTSTTLKIFKEYAWDFEVNEFILKDGKFIVAEGLEALKVWIRKVFMTPRFRYLAYSWKYGHELENLVGSDVTKPVIVSEAKRYVEEALLVSPYISRIDNLSVSSDKDNLTINFTAKTVYGEADISV